MRKATGQLTLLAGTVIPLKEPALAVLAAEKFAADEQKNEEQRIQICQHFTPAEQYIQTL
jgi:hypothetical protein